MAVLVVLSAAFEALFLRHGLNVLDEGWPLYAAMRLHAGASLYRDAFFVFPPGHVLVAWLAYAWDPPGLVLTRILYAVFDVALCVAIYCLGRRLMPPAGALLGAALLAVAAPDSHGSHYLFGYRYLVFSVVALWCFSQRLRGGDRRWMVAAGALTGVAMLFRLTPAIAVACGIGAAVLVAEPRWRSRWQEALGFALGFAMVIGPALAWFALGVGLHTLWREAVVRPIAMTHLQSLPVPDLQLPTSWSRPEIRRSFVTFQFRLWTLLYLLYAAALAVPVARSLLGRRSFRSPLLLAVVVFGGLYFLRSFGRSDEAHLDSAIPPVCLLLAYAACAPLRRALAGSFWRRGAAWTALLAVFGAWVYLTALDLYVRQARSIGQPVRTLDGAVGVRPHSRFRNFDRMVWEIRQRSRPDDVVLDMTASSLLYVVSGRRSPGGADVVMPGTFLDAGEERAFLDRLERRPPRLVILSVEPFDRLPSRDSSHWAPLLTRWVRERYMAAARIPPWILMVPRGSPAPSSTDPSPNAPSPTEGAGDG